MTTQPRTPGDYALLHANGMSWTDVVALIREEWLQTPKHCECPPVFDTCCCEYCTRHVVV